MKKMRNKKMRKRTRKMTKRTEKGGGGRKEEEVMMMMMTMTTMMTTAVTLTSEDGQPLHVPTSIQLVVSLLFSAITSLYFSR